MASRWQEGAALAFDTETSGTDVETDCIVQLALAEIDWQQGAKLTFCDLVRPAREIPPEAIDVHGITNERALRDGIDPVVAVERAAEAIERAWRAGIPLIVTNASFDLTLLDRELRRHAGRPLDLTGALVVDPLVVDRACDTYRPGGRKLVDLAEHYQVKVTDAHDALGDCMTAARVVWRQVRTTATEGPGKNGRTRRMDYSPLRELGLPELHAWQAERYSEWAAGYELYLHTKAEPRQPDAVIDRAWPWRPFAEAGVAA